MSTVVPFRRPIRDGAGVGATNVDATVLVFMPVPELRELLWQWPQRCASDPLLLRNVLQVIAEALARPAPDAAARNAGWRSARARRDHAEAMRELLLEFSAEDGSWIAPSQG